MNSFRDLTRANGDVGAIDLGTHMVSESWFRHVAGFALGVCQRICSGEGLGLNFNVFNEDLHTAK